MNSPIIVAAEEYVSSLMQEKLTSRHYYHNLLHTRDVVAYAKEISKGENLTEAEQEIVILAAWFHDVGYTEKYIGHEEESQEIASEFLRQHSFPEEKILIVKNCILSTKYLHHSGNVLESVLIDADRLTMGRPDFKEKGELLRKEWEYYLDKTHTDEEWAQIQVMYLQETEFNTRYAFMHYQKVKDQHLKYFKELVIQFEHRTNLISLNSRKYLQYLVNQFVNATGSLFLGFSIGISLSLTVWGNLNYAWGIGIISGLLIGLSLRIGDRWFDRYIIRKFSFPVSLVIGTMMLILLFKASQYAGMILYDLMVAEMRFSEITESRIFHDIISSQGVFILLWSAFLISLILNTIKLTSRIIGPGMMKSYLIGRYHKPVEEERIFMFLDINSSTSMAEQMGIEKYHDMLNRFFYDIGSPISRSRGEIYQYVGDEVVVTWKMKDGLEQANCIRCYFRILKQMEKMKPEYTSLFGFMPEFKVGMHAGKVITGEVGRTKTEIVFHGDVINTTERILNQCINLGKKILISENLIRRIALLPNVHAEYVTTRLFKGKENEVSLYTLIKK
ncbi:MAG: HD domain-containing protein [Candidatus Competibacteraceae bacterium]|nr:HD domain-containing protein [Candidatus Competibacteraceae bacterium]